MKTAIIAVSRAGLLVAASLKNLYPGAHLYAPPRLIKKESDEIRPLAAQGKLQEALAPLFFGYELLVFISATQIAVRLVAPFLQGKDRDPAVVVVDDQGHFAISLLSGHLGGANEETKKIAALLSAQAVITTATDSRNITAFDTLARKFGWQIENLKELKKISAALLEDKEVFVYSERPFCYEFLGRIKTVDWGQVPHEDLGGCVFITSLLDPAPAQEPCLVPKLLLRPRSVVAGMGCRKGVPAEKIISIIEQGFKKADRSLKSLLCLATGEFKAGEKGLLEAARHFAVPLKIYSVKQIAANLKDSVCSDFVKQQVGVGAVAEPCARLGSGGGDLVLPKQKEAGVTLALAEVARLPFLVGDEINDP